MRSPQQYLILAPERQQRFAFTTGDSDDSDGWGFKFPHAFAIDHGGFDAWAMLARPVRSQVVSLPTFKATGSMSNFDVLSNELIAMIFEHVVEDATDFMALGLTCVNFWHLVSSHIQKSYLASSAPWAGTRLIFQGSWVTDLPDILTSCEAAKAVNNRRLRMPMSRQLFWGLFNNEAPDSIALQEIAWQKAATKHRESAQIAESVWSNIELSISSRALFPRDRTWILRNLTKKVFVSSAGPTSMRLRGDRKISAVDFNTALLLKIVWMSQSAPVWAKNGERGKWAGDQFDIVTEEAHVGEEGKGWEDGTAVVGRELIALKHWLKGDDTDED